MKKTPHIKGIASAQLIGIGLPIHEMIPSRTRDPDPAEAPARTQAPEVGKVPVESQPTDGSDLDPQETVLVAAPEAGRWDPGPGSLGRQAPESPSEDEDDEGRSETEQLVEGGVAEAERDQMVQAARAAKHTADGQP